MKLRAKVARVPGKHADAESGKILLLHGEPGCQKGNTKPRIRRDARDGRHSLGYVARSRRAQEDFSDDDGVPYGFALLHHGRGRALLHQVVFRHVVSEEEEPTALRVRASSHYL